MEAGSTSARCYIEYARLEPDNEKATQALLQSRGNQSQARRAFRPAGRARHRSREAAGALEGRRRTQSAQSGLLEGAGRMLPGRPQLRARPPRRGARASRRPPILPSASACGRPASPSSSSAWITRPPKGGAKPRKTRASSPNSSSRRSRTCTSSKPNTTTAPPRPAPEARAVVGRPQPSGKVRGTLRQVDCLGSQARADRRKRRPQDGAAAGGGLRQGRDRRALASRPWAAASRPRARCPSNTSPRPMPVWEPPARWPPSSSSDPFR